MQETIREADDLAAHHGSDWPAELLRRRGLTREANDLTGAALSGEAGGNGLPDHDPLAPPAGEPASRAAGRFPSSSRPTR
jgi:hypothetical protein